MSLPIEAERTTDMCNAFQKCFEENLIYLEERHPALYQFACRHTPQQANLGISDSGYPTLISTSTEAQITSNNLAQATKQYLAEFVENPLFISYGPKLFSAKQIEQDTCLTPFLRALNESVPTPSPSCKITTETPIPIAICFGQALGDIVSQLPELYDIQHLVVYEPDLDHFYASLFVQDFKAISQPFENPQRSITFVLGDSPEHLCNTVYTIAQMHGYFLLAYVLMLEPLPTPRTTAAKSRYQQLAHRMIQGWGYFTDELAGLRQTLENCQHGITLIATTPTNKALQNLPCCVVGNGPSIDLCLDFLRSNQESMLIISAGTTVHTLLKHHIQPDFHVEIERAEGTYLHLKSIKDADFFKKTPLLTLNTIRPEVAKLFSTVYTFLKEGDLGTETLIGHSLTPNKILALSHPLVGNGAAAIAVELGCKNIFLMGMDLCVAPSGLLHSQDSIYNDGNSPLHDKNRYFSYTTQGSFGNSVLTDQLFDSSRLSLELLINAHQDRSFINIGQGIKITGTTPLQNPDDITLTGTCDKPALIKQALAGAHTTALSAAQINELKRITQEATKRSIRSLQKQLWTKDCHDCTTVINCFVQQIALLTLSKTQDTSSFRLLKGSLAYLQTQVLYHLLFLPTAEERQQYLVQARKIFKNYFLHIKSEMQQALSCK